MANFIARCLATPFSAGCDHGTEFVPDMANALKNKPENINQSIIIRLSC